MEIFIMGIKGTNILQIDKFSITENAELHRENKDAMGKKSGYRDKRGRD
ncbi:MAG: hypothetical protein KatS3mg028_0089 [Bacteroidia bacterium]|nr:MAG: hypothetical protein KatS3mg028_0089 [Bacteroidia bacterium]